MGRTDDGEEETVEPSGRAPSATSGKPRSEPP